MTGLRLLWLELRHNSMACLVPVVVGLFWLITYRKTMAMAPLWNLRATGLQSGTVIDFAVPVTGAAAWMGARETRRRILEQVTITARPRWTRLLITWVATTIWAEVAYLGCLAAVYGVTAHQASWGGPLWWPAAVAAASVPAFSALGFAIGTVLPSRFTPPLAAIAAFFIVALSTELITGSQSYWQVSPVVTGPWDMGSQAGLATFYPFVPDLSIAQVMFLAGFTVALLGTLALPAASGRAPNAEAGRGLRAGSGRAGSGRVLRLVAAGCTTAGLLAAGTAVRLAGTGTMDASGMIAIAALHDAASDQPLHFTPVCSRTAIPLCLNPAYAIYLSATADALAPLLSQLAGLPGAPARIVQDSMIYQQGGGNCFSFRPGSPADSGSSSVFHLVLPDQALGPAMTASQMARATAATYGSQIVARVIGDGPGDSPAQSAVAAALMEAAGMRAIAVVIPTPSNQCPPVNEAHAARGTRTATSSRDGQSGRTGSGGPDTGQSPVVADDTPVAAAAERFAASPASVRRTWLVRHLAALRAGQITLAQLP
jgi:hypothetical protein